MSVKQSRRSSTSPIKNRKRYPKSVKGMAKLIRRVLRLERKHPGKVRVSVRRRK